MGVWDNAGYTVLYNLKSLAADNSIIQAQTGTNPDDPWIAIELAEDPILHAKCIAGDFGDIETYVAAQAVDGSPVVTVESARLKIVFQENALLEPATAKINGSLQSLQLAWNAQTWQTNGLVITYLKNNLKWADDAPITDEEWNDMFEQTFSMVL